MVVLCSVFTCYLRTEGIVLTNKKSFLDRVNIAKYSSPIFGNPNPDLVSIQYFSLFLKLPFIGILLIRIISHTETIVNS